MKKLGLITVGQAPRDDVIIDLLPIFGPEIELIQAGALDGLSLQEISSFAPQDGDYVLVSRLKDGSSAVFAERYIIPRLQECIFKLEKGIDLFHSREPSVIKFALCVVVKSNNSA